MRTSNSLFLFLLAFLFSCHKEEPLPENKPKPPVYSEYMPLKIGNYWIYQEYSTDANGNEISSSIDSIFISKDTLIDNKTFYKLDRSEPSLPPYLIPLFISDSSGYLLVGPGSVILSPDSMEVFQQEGSNNKQTSYTCRKDSIVNTPAGTFHNTITFRTFVEGKNAFPNGNYYRVFEKNIGIIQRAMFYASDPDQPFGIKLLRYRVN